MVKHTCVVVLMLTFLGCSQPNWSPLVANRPAPPPTKAAYVRQLCVAMVAFEERHEAWHWAHRDLNDHHWDASFVPEVNAPLLPVFDNPPEADRAAVAALRDSFKNASAKFEESAQRWNAGDKEGAMVAEGEAFGFIFGEFPQLLERYGFNEQTCPELRWANAGGGIWRRHIL